MRYVQQPKRNDRNEKIAFTRIVLKYATALNRMVMTLPHLLINWLKLYWDNWRVNGFFPCSPFKMWKFLKTSHEIFIPWHFYMLDRCPLNKNPTKVLYISFYKFLKKKHFFQVVAENVIFHLLVREIHINFSTLLFVPLIFANINFNWCNLFDTYMSLIQFIVWLERTALHFLYLSQETIFTFFVARTQPHNATSLSPPFRYSFAQNNNKRLRKRCVLPATHTNAYNKLYNFLTHIWL